MDIQRSILIVALAIVSYLMVLQWNQDYGQAALPTASTSASSAQSTLPDDNATAKTSDDVPTATNAERSEPAATQAVAPSNDLIRVETDVLHLAIDPVTAGAAPT